MNTVNLFLIGAMKAGTTSVAAALSRHGDIVPASIKEPNHFAQELHDARIGTLAPEMRGFDVEAFIQDEDQQTRHHAYIARREHYDALYASLPEARYYLDASTTYLNSPRAADLVHAYNPDARIIAVLRDPAARGWSEFLMNERIGVATGSPLDALEREANEVLAGRVPLFERYVSTGFYEHHLRRWDKFPDKQRLILDFEDLKCDWEGQMRKVFAFLDLPMDGYDFSAVRENVGSTASRFPRLNKWAHRTGVKYVVRDLLPDGVKQKVKHMMSKDGDGVSMREDFLAAFPNYRARLEEEFR